METPGDEEREPAAGGPLRGRLRRLLAGRPLSVYGILLAGVAVLALLLLVVFLTSQPDQVDGPRGCLSVDPAEAERSIRAGLVERIDIVTDRDDVETGPVLVTLDLVAEGDSCRELPQGVASQPDLYRLIGFAETYNQTRAGETRMDITWRTDAIPPPLLATATPSPTMTPVPAPTATPSPTPGPAPIVVPTATATATATALPTATATPPAPASPTQAPPLLASPEAATPERAATFVPLPSPGGGTQGSSSPTG